MGSTPHAERRLRLNFYWLWGMCFSRRLLVLMSLYVPYLKSHGLSMSQIMLTQSIFGMTVIALEVPSGYLADMFGRKRTLLLGALFSGLGFSVFAWADSFFWFVTMEVLLAIGLSMMSGADIALLYDSHHQLQDQGHDVNQSAFMLSRLSLANTLGEATGAALSAMLVIVSMDWVILTQVIAGWLAILFVLPMVEPSYHKMQGESHRENFKFVLHKTFFRGPWFTSMIVVWLILSISTWLAVWMFQAIWTAQDIDLAWFGWLWCLKSIMVSLMIYLAPHGIQTWGRRATVIAAVILMGIAYFALSVATGLWVVLPIFLFSSVRGLASVALGDAISQSFDSSFRATGNSMLSFAFRFLTVITAPMMGYGMDAWGVKTTIILIGLGLFILALGVAIPWLLRSTYALTPKAELTPTTRAETNNVESVIPAAK